MNTSLTQRGRLITAEGIEGAGKTTHLTTIQEFLNIQGISTMLTREPGATSLGAIIREWLLSPDNSPEPATELCLLFADRAEHINKVISPALKAGHWVISDRFVDASIAYQGGGRRIPSGVIDTLAQYICQGIKPELTFWFDVPIATARERIAMRGDADRFEMEDAGFFERTKEAYRLLSEQDPIRWRRIDTDRPRDQVKTKIEDILQQFIHIHE